MKTLREWAKEKVEIKYADGGKGNDLSGDIIRELFKKLGWILSGNSWYYKNASEFVIFDVEELEKKRLAEIEQKQGKICIECKKLKKGIKNMIGKGQMDFIKKERLERKRLHLDNLNTSWVELEKQKYENIFPVKMGPDDKLFDEEERLFNIVFELMMDGQKGRSNYLNIKKNRWEEIELEKKEQLLLCVQEILELERWDYDEEQYRMLEHKIKSPQKTRVYIDVFMIDEFLTNYWDMLENDMDEYEKQLSDIRKKMECTCKYFDEQGESTIDLEEIIKLYLKDLEERKLKGNIN